MREGWKRGRGRRGSWRGSQQLVTSCLSQKAYLGAMRRRRREKEKGEKIYSAGEQSRRKNEVSAGLFTKVSLLEAGGGRKL